jgi:transposase
MAEAYPIELRERVVFAYESGEGTYSMVARRFVLGESTVKRWVLRYRQEGSVAARPKQGGTRSSIREKEISALILELRDPTAGELTGAFNRFRRGKGRVHVSSMKRALHRYGYVVKKKRRRPLESLRADVAAKRRAFRRQVRHIPVGDLVFLDESGLTVRMSRSHAWVKRGTEHIDRVPVNWGKNLTLLGAMRIRGWVVLSTTFASANKERFVQWLKRRLIPKLRSGDVVVMDNLGAHHDPRVAIACAAHGVRALYLPPYSPDLNPIESGWALQKKQVRRDAPRSADALRRAARRARLRVTPRHCRGWVKHCGYVAG